MSSGLPGSTVLSLHVDDGYLYAGLNAGGVWRQSVSEPCDARCCVGRAGDANGLGTYPQEVTISDIQTLVTAKFIVGSCAALACLAEGDANQSGGANPTCQDITISDIQTLVNHLFICGPSNCPLKDCL
jgi:hypothetical protein